MSIYGRAPPLGGGVKFGLFIFIAQKIHCDGLRTISHLWSSNDGGFRYWEETRDRFGIDPNEQCI
jgi:hypothetical protein